MGKFTLTKEEMERFLDEPWLTFVGTLTKTGHPHVTPIWSYYDGQHFYLTLLDGNPKRRAVARDNRVALAIGNYTPPYKAVVVHGTAELIRRNVRPIVRKLVVKYLGDEQADTITDMLMKEPQVIVKVTPRRIYSWDQSKGTFDEVLAAEKTGKDFRTV